MYKPTLDPGPNALWAEVDFYRDEYNSAAWYYESGESARESHARRCSDPLVAVIGQG